MSVRLFWKELTSAILPVQKHPRYPVESDRILALRRSGVGYLLFFCTVSTGEQHDISRPLFSSLQWDYEWKYAVSGILLDASKSNHLWSDHDWGAGVQDLQEWCKWPERIWRPWVLWGKRKTQLLLLGSHAQLCKTSPVLSMYGRQAKRLACRSCSNALRRFPLETQNLKD